MLCTHPVLLKNPDMKVPCGRCYNCRKAKAREWALRLLHESTEWDAGLMLTLTYNDDHLPADMSLHKSHLQKFIKRLRKRLGRGRRIKYFASAEYGSDRGRPHFHLAIFGVSLGDERAEPAPGGPGRGFYLRPGGPCHGAWHPRGFLHAAPLNYGTLRYLTDYITKACKSKLKPQRLETHVWQGDVTSLSMGYDPCKPFRLQSQGIGLKYLQKNKARLARDMGCRVSGGRIAPLPTYYLKKIQEIYGTLEWERAWLKYFADKDTVERIDALHPGASRAGHTHGWLRAEADQIEKNRKALERLSK